MMRANIHSFIKPLSLQSLAAAALVCAAFLSAAQAAAPEDLGSGYTKPARSALAPAIRSAAGCIACHTQADQGDFNERSVRIPR